MIKPIDNNLIRPYEVTLITNGGVCRVMYYNIKYFKNNHNWRPSLGEKLDKIHFRNGHQHAVCDPSTGVCTVHYDKIDPHESPDSLVKHMWGSNLGKAALALGVIAGIAGADHFFNDGKIRKSITDYL